MKSYFLGVLVGASLLVAGCVPTQPAAPMPESPTTVEVPGGSAATTPITEFVEEALASPSPEANPLEPEFIPVEALKNATYSGIYDEPVILTDGLYEGEPFIQGDASHPIVEYIDGTELYGDLDGDGVDDAVVFLLDSAGGSGTFTQVAAQLNRDGQPLDAGAVMVGDRIGVRSAAMEDGQIVLEVITQGPGDVACCSTHKARQTYALQEGRLVETTPEGGDLVQVSASDLDGTSWTLTELNYGQPAATDVPVILSFQGGRITGSGGCNSYTASFTLGDENPLVMNVGPVIATQMMCPDAAAREAAYFSALEKVSHWGYVFGDLGLFYDDGEGELGRLLFAPNAVSEAAPADELIGQTWQWTSFTSPVEQFDVETSSSYLLTFNEDGTVTVAADCKSPLSTYREYEGALSIEVGPTTMELCPGESRSDQFMTLLGGAARYFFEDGMLYIDLMADGGTMVFAPAGAEPTEANADTELAG